MRPLMMAAVMTALVWIPIAGRGPDSALESAALAWDRGDYVAALTAYLQVLNGPAGAESLPAIALQTGELFKTIELTRDGDAPEFSPDGRYVVYETGAQPARTIRLATAADPRTPA